MLAQFNCKIDPFTISGSVPWLSCMAYDRRQNSLFEFQIHHFNFQLQQLNCTAQFKILHSSFRFHIIGRRVEKKRKISVQHVFQ